MPTGAAYPGSRRVLLLVVMFAVVAAAALLYLIDPGGLGAVAYGVTALVLCLVIAFGPITLGARPLRIWLFATAAALALAPALGGAQFAGVTGDPGGLAGSSLSTIFSLLARLCAGTWLVALILRIGRATAVRGLLDTAAVATSAGIAVWTVVGTQRDSGLAVALGWAAYPVADLLLLALIAHPVIRMGARNASWRWLFAAMIVQVIVDTAFALTGPLIPGSDAPLLWAGYLMVGAMLAAAATNPAAIDLVSGAPHPRRRGQATRGVALIITAVLLAVGAMAVPVHDVRGGIIRSGLVALLLLLLFARLLLTMHELGATEVESRHRARYDELTGLLNRSALFEVLDERLTSTPDALSGLIALLSIDCDDFKRVNDTWGHRAGDLLLKQIAVGLTETLRPNDVVARGGGDEFAAVAEVTSATEAKQLVRRVEQFFTRPMSILPHRSHSLTVSIGVALASPGDGLTPTALLRAADIAMYEAKIRGRAQHVVFDDQLEKQARVQARISDALPGALARGEITVHLQPIYTGPGYRTLAGWEALARWYDPALGQVPPDQFIPLAEQLGLIEALGEAVLRRACLAVAELRRHLDLPGAMITVNISALQMRQPGFDRIVAEALANADLAGGHLWLEITESLQVDRGPHVLGTLESVRRTGVRICMDDFGSGHASLATLLRLPIDCVKIDRNLTTTLMGPHGDGDKLRSLLHMLQALGIRHVVAEGVETPEQEAVLAASGFPMVQGWLYGKPSPPAALLAQAGSSRA